MSDYPNRFGGRFGMSGYGPLGFEIIEDPYMANRVQYKFPRSKKGRIRKKWAKKSSNYRYVPNNKVYQIGDKMVMHPSIAAKLRQHLENL